MHSPPPCLSCPLQRLRSAPSAGQAPLLPSRAPPPVTPAPVAPSSSALAAPSVTPARAAPTRMHAASRAARCAPWVPSTTSRAALQWAPAGEAAGGPGWEGGLGAEVQARVLHGPGEGRGGGWGCRQGGLWRIWKGGDAGRVLCGMGRWLCQSTCCCCCSYTSLWIPVGAYCCDTSAWGAVLSVHDVSSLYCWSTC